MLRVASEQDFSMGWAGVKMMEEFPSIPGDPAAAQGGGRDSAARGTGRFVKTFMTS